VRSSLRLAPIPLVKFLTVGPYFRGIVPNNLESGASVQPLWKKKVIRRRGASAALLALSCLLVLVCRAQAQRNVAEVRAPLSSIVNPDFAIADFDGDRQPDLATVEAGLSTSAGNTRYSIRFKLTSGDAQVFGVTAPVGGLQIVARDVNGDNALDLLVSTAWQHRQVAVLLNDGHGNFTLASPGAVAASAWEDESQWDSRSLPRGDSAALLRFQASADSEQEQCRCRCLPRQVGLATQSVSRGLSTLFLSSLFGRAPPPAILQA
jgi:hypothetical protein